MKRAHGFTLIELMAVVAIIGILAAVSVSVFQDYFVRSRVTEGLALVDTAKTSVTENAAAAIAFSKGWTPPTATANVTGIAIDAGNGEITISYTASAGNGTLVLAPRDGGPAGAALALGTTPSGNIAWNCNSAGSTKAGSKGTLQDKYAPANCRS